MKPANSHLSDDQLLDRLYGLGESGLPHLRECEECSGRLESLNKSRSEVLAAASAGMESGISNEALLAQRRAIYNRLDSSSFLRGRWVPAALGVAFLLVTGVFLERPHAAYAPVIPSQISRTESSTEINNEKLLSDLYSMEESVEPSAAAPIHGLFEGSTGDGAQ